MGLRLEIVSQHRQALGAIGIKEFGQDGGTIGRSLSNDWALPDRNRFLSAKHASIDYRSGSYYIVDTSTNGVYVNESETPVGRGNPQRLFEGDRVRIGEYLMVAKIEMDEGTMDALVLESHVDPVDRAQRVETPDATGYDLLDEHVMTGVGIEIMLDDTGEKRPVAPQSPAKLKAVAEPTSHTRSLLLDAEQAKAAPKLRSAPAPNPPASAQPGAAAPKPAAAAPAAPATAAPSANLPPRVRQPQQRPPARDPAADEGSSADSSISAFFRGAGLKNHALNEQECNATLFLLGQLVRELLTGLTESLHLRAQQKNQLKLSNTTIQKRDNNPLKFSAGTSEALKNLLFRTSREYMGPVEAVRDAYADINSHQLALLKALATAVPEYVNRLDPIVLEDKFARAGRGSLMGATSKLKHWELYKDLFQVVAHHNQGQLPVQFLEELARAYETENEREAVVRGRSKKEATQA